MALLTSIAVLLDFVWRAETLATWCIGNREMEPPARVNPYLGGGGRFAPVGRFAPPYSNHCSKVGKLVR